MSTPEQLPEPRHVHRAGEVTSIEMAAGEQHVHDLANTGDTLLYATTEVVLAATSRLLGGDERAEKRSLPNH